MIVGFDPPSLVAEMTTLLVEWFATADPSVATPSATDIEPFVRFNVALMPTVLGVILTLMLVLNLWLGAIVARTSGRLLRPRETLWTVELPMSVVFGFALAVVLAFVPGPVGYAAQAFAGALGAAAALVGLAVVHALTVGFGGRLILLTLTYIIVFVSGFAPIVLVLLGIGERFLNLRARRQGGGVRP
jgi:hypothetical protein